MTRSSSSSRKSGGVWVRARETRWVPNLATASARRCTTIDSHARAIPGQCWPNTRFGRRSRFISVTEILSAPTEAASTVQPDSWRAAKMSARTLEACMRSSTHSRELVDHRLVQHGDQDPGCRRRPRRLEDLPRDALGEHAALARAGSADDDGRVVVRAGRLVLLVVKEQRRFGAIEQGVSNRSKPLDNPDDRRRRRSPCRWLTEQGRPDCTGACAYQRPRTSWHCARVPTSTGGASSTLRRDQPSDSTVTPWSSSWRFLGAVNRTAPRASSSSPSRTEPLGQLVDVTGVGVVEEVATDDQRARVTCGRSKVRPRRGLERHFQPISPLTHERPDFVEDPGRDVDHERAGVGRVDNDLGGTKVVSFGERGHEHCHCAHGRTVPHPTSTMRSGSAEPTTHGARARTASWVRAPWYQRA